jgi:hypothetical protein
MSGRRRRRPRSRPRQPSELDLEIFARHPYTDDELRLLAEDLLYQQLLQHAATALLASRQVADAKEAGKTRRHRRLRLHRRESGRRTTTWVPPHNPVAQRLAPRRQGNPPTR